MTSSPEPRLQADDDLPPALVVDVAAVQARLPPRAAADARRVRCSSLLAALPDALIALWLKLLGERRPRAQRADSCVAAAVALGVSAAATWFLRTVSTRVQRRFRDKVTIALESHVARLQASIATIAHQERPDYLDRLAMLRDQVFVLDHMYMSVFSTCGWILRLGVTMALLDRRFIPRWRCSPCSRCRRC